MFVAWLDASWRAEANIIDSAVGLPVAVVVQVRCTVAWARRSTTDAIAGLNR
jgi:hypothetical protein